jgi:hypothetical protein
MIHLLLPQSLPCFLCNVQNLSGSGLSWSAGGCETHTHTELCLQLTLWFPCSSHLETLSNLLIRGPASHYVVTSACVLAFKQSFLLRCLKCCLTWEGPRVPGGCCDTAHTVTACGNFGKYWRLTFLTF